MNMLNLKMDPSKVSLKEDIAFSWMAMSFLFVHFKIRSEEIYPGIRKKSVMLRVELVGVVDLR